MNRTSKWLVLCFAFFLAANGLSHFAFADNDDYQGKHRYQKRARRHSYHDCKRNLTGVNNPTYKNNCGSCHFAYQPELLPSGSWEKILSGIEDHYGNAIELDSESKKVISKYLTSNAADFSSAKLAGKIMRDVGAQEPIRITTIPYIQNKHNEISKSVLERESIGSFSNCSACHLTAENGIYDEDKVKIPR